MKDLDTSRLKGGLERRYAACADLKPGFDLAVALHDYVEYINTHPVIDHLFTNKIQAGARKLYKDALDDSHMEKLKKLLKEKLVKATETERKEAQRVRVRLEELQKKQSTLVQKNLDGVISDDLLKQQLALIENESADIKVFLSGIQENEHDPLELLEFAEEYLKKPSALWKEANLERKIKLQWFEFPSGLVFDGEKFRTDEIACVFKIKDALSASKFYQVDPTGFEPATPSVQMRCSTK